MKRFLVRLVIVLACVALAAALWYFKVRSLVSGHGPPGSSQLLFQNVGDADRDVLKAVYLVLNLKSGDRATGLLVDGGFILTDAHVVAGAHLGDLDVFSSAGVKTALKGLEVDGALDVAFLSPAGKLAGGVDLDETGPAGPGEQVYSWGYPSNVDPPLPLLAMGYVSGYREVAGAPGVEPDARLVLGGPFTEGSAGGPLFRWKDSALVGLVVTRPAPPDAYLARLLKALSSARPGDTLAVADEKGRPRTVTFGEAAAEAVARAEAVHRGPVAEAVPFSLIKPRLEGMR